MDEMKIRSALMKSVISKLLTGAVKKATGADCEVWFNPDDDIRLSVADGGVTLHVNADIKADTGILKHFGLF